MIISGFRDEAVARHFKPEKVAATNLTVRSVIGSLPDPAFFARNLDKSAIPHHENHWTMRPVSKRFSRPGGADRGGRSFRRLEWDRPSPTVAYGHREIHVHPDGRRRLSIFEAMLLQGFQEDFVLEGTLSSQVEQVSNAVPPPLAQSLAATIGAAMLRAGDSRSQAGRLARETIWVRPIVARHHILSEALIRLAYTYNRRVESKRRCLAWILLQAGPLGLSFRRTRTSPVEQRPGSGHC